MFNTSDTKPNLAAVFFLDAVHLTFKSNEAGRPIYEDREFVRIVVPGQVQTELVREVRDEDKDRWHKEYSAFKRGLDQEAVSGTPLTALTWMTPSQVREMAAIKVFTVEHLAAMSDSIVSNVGMGGRELRAKAQAYLTAASDASSATKFAAEIEGLSSENADLKAQLKALADRMESMDAELTKSRKKAA